MNNRENNLQLIRSPFFNRLRLLLHGFRRLRFFYCAGRGKTETLFVVRIPTPCKYPARAIETTTDLSTNVEKLPVWIEWLDSKGIAAPAPLRLMSTKRFPETGTLHLKKSSDVCFTIKFT